MMSQADRVGELPEGPRVFSSGIGWTEALSVPFKPPAGPHLGHGRHRGTHPPVWGCSEMWKTCLRSTMTDRQRKFHLPVPYDMADITVTHTHTHTPRHTAAWCFSRHILPWWSWLRGLHSAHADGCWGTLPLPWWWLLGGHSHCHGDDGRSQACQPMRWWIDAMQEAKGKRD